jgi:general secretion pathway protein J
MMAACKRTSDLGQNISRKSRGMYRVEEVHVERGFTLLEVLIALFVFGLIASAGFAAYRGTFTVIDETESQEDIYRMARTALDRITEDLASAYFPEATLTQGADPSESEEIPFYGEEEEIDGIPCVGLRFLSLAHLDLSDDKGLAEPAEIAYYGAAGRQEGVVDLYRSDTSLNRERPEAGTGGLLLCKGLSSIRLRFWDAAGDPHEAWNSSEGISKGKLPSRVSMVMEFPNAAAPDRPYRFTTGIAIPMGG